MKGDWPIRFRWAHGTLRAVARLLLNSTIAPRLCNICRYEGLFCAHGTPPRLDSRCPSCKSLERHRLFKLWFDNNSALLKGRAILHFAPEHAVRSFVEPLAGTYVTADLDPRKADYQVNIEDIAFPEGSFDTILCSHVLEHVDDRKARGEMHRILRQGGLLLMMTPVVWAWDTTYENPAIVTDRDRVLHLAQKNHVRYFGANIVRRIENAGFRVSLFKSSEPAVSLHSLLRDDVLFACWKV